MTGGGFGGCIVTLLQSDCANEVREKILTQYESEIGVQGSSFVSRPALGAHLIKRSSNDS
jgi:galactokinase